MRAIKFMLMVFFGVILFSWARKTDLASICLPIVCSSGEAAHSSSGDPAQDTSKIDSAFLLVYERFPMKAVLAVKGELPTPCHALVWEVSGPNMQNIIEVTTFAEPAQQRFCIQILEPFEVQIPLGDFTELGFSVHLNGDVIGDL
jgi:hypothetical protein